MAMSILLKLLTLKRNISRTIGRIEVGDGSSFCIFHALSFELNFFFDRRFPLITQIHILKAKFNKFLSKFGMAMAVLAIPVPMACMDNS